MKFSSLACFKVIFVGVLAGCGEVKVKSNRVDLNRDSIEKKNGMANDDSSAVVGKANFSLNLANLALIKINMAQRKNKRRKKVRYSEIRIRLSMKQKRSLINYCQARKTTPNKLIKKMIRPYISNYSVEVPEEYYITENQLDLFGDNEVKEDDPQQDQENPELTLF